MANPFRAAATAMDRSSFKGRGGYRASGSGFDGAGMGRLYNDWDAWTMSPDFEQRFQFRLVRARARAMARNNPWIVGFLDELANNVVGAHGILLQARVKNALGKFATSTNDEIERGWLEWGHQENASADGHDSFVELQRIIIQTIATDGECFVRRIRGADNAFRYTLQIVDADLVDETLNRAADAGQNAIRMGVEVDKHNKAIAYHVYTRYAEDMTGEPRVRERILAEDMLHLFVRWYRGNTVRGVSWFAPVLVPARHLEAYELNHLVASRVGAAQMAFILNKHPDAVAGFTPPKKGEKLKTFEAEPGSIPELLPGQEVQQFNPNFPATGYEQFVMAVLRAMARALKVSYLTLTGDLRQASYSSMRAGEVPQRDRWRGLQGWGAAAFHRIGYRDWVDLAALAHAIAVDGRLGSDYYAVLWHGRGWKWVDPLNDLKAAKMELDLGLNSRTRLNAERGFNYEHIVDELSDEQDYAESKDVDVSGNQMSGVNPTTVSPDGAADDKDEQGDQNGSSGSDNSSRSTGSTNRAAFAAAS
jgi:lambda family phage portal protein